MPVACTHANARSFFGSQRNKTDDALRLIAERGGVIGTTLCPPFFRKGWKSTLEDFADAIEDMVERVGIGSDYTQGHIKEWFAALMSQQGTKPLEHRQGLSGCARPS